MDKFFIDESGYTGDNLLDENQRFQGASSIRIDEENARSLVKKHFPNLKLNELKHGKLSRKNNNWDSLLSIQSELLKHHMGLSYVCDKKYLLTLMFLNSCVEPFYFDNGIDFYKDGYNYALASLLYKVAPVIWGKKHFEELLKIFQHATKTKSDVAIQGLIQKAGFLRGQELWKECLSPLWHRHPSCLSAIRSPNSYTDAAIVALIALISRIEHKVDSAYEIIHDTSKGMIRHDKHINCLIHERTEVEFKRTEITTLAFPLKLSAFSQINSCDSYGIQLADILVGGAIEFANATAGFTKENQYNQQVRKLYTDNFLYLIPNLDFEELARFHSANQAGELIEFVSRSFNSYSNF